MKKVLIKSLFAIAFFGLVLSCEQNKSEEQSLNSNNKEMKATLAYLEITLLVNDENRPAAAALYSKYKQPFLNQIDGALSKELLLRTDDIQVIHGFETEEAANAYLQSTLFSTDIVGELGPLLDATPDVKVYSVFRN